MTRRELWDCIYDAAAGVYDRREARAFAAFVCEGRLGMRFTDVIVEPDAPCPDREDLPDILATLEALPEWTETAVHEALLGLAARKGKKNGVILWPARIAMAGKLVTPCGAIEIAVLLGREEALRRLRASLEKLQK